MRVLSSINIVALLLFVVITSPTGVMAHGGAKGIVKERMQSMAEMGTAMKYVGGMVRDKAELDMNAVDLAAKSIISHGRQIPVLFPKGSDKGVTEASPKIWADMNGFENSVGKMIAAAEALSLAAQAGDRERVKSSHKDLGRTCSGCHKQYRVKTVAKKHRSGILSRVTKSISGFFGN